MKLPLKHIVILVILSLSGIFAYQTYWLTSLYRTMKDNVEQNIMEAMRMSDYNEMMLRVANLRNYGEKHGEVTVSAGYTDEGKAFVQSSTTTHWESNEQDSLTKVKTLFMNKDTAHVTLYEDSTQIKLSVNRDSLSQYNCSEKGRLTIAANKRQNNSQNINSKNDVPQSSDTCEKDTDLTANSNLDLILKDKNSMLELAINFQRGLHAGLDALLEPNLQVYDSLLTFSLRSRDIYLPHQTFYLQSSYSADSTYIYTDTLGIVGDSKYEPSPNAKNYEYAFDLKNNQTYCLLMEPVTTMVLKQMSGILTTSFIILIILLFSFWFLIRIILRQKTLEEITSDFTNNITHELKTPIAVAYAANDALLNFNQAEEKIKRDKYLRICQDQLQRLSGLVEQILSMSMEKRKTFRLHLEHLELKSMLDSLIELHKLKADKPIDISCQIDPLNLTVLVDRTHFSNIISNLIDNAIKYSPEKAEIAIYCRQYSEGKIEISVSDRGIGISTEKQKHIFDKFYRVPTGNLHNVKGYGLGLYYVRTMVEMHGGTVSVESIPEQGSTFKISINN